MFHHFLNHRTSYKNGVPVSMPAGKVEISTFRRDGINYTIETIYYPVRGKEPRIKSDPTIIMGSLREHLNGDRALQDEPLPAKKQRHYVRSDKNKVSVTGRYKNSHPKEAEFRSVAEGRA